MGLFGANMDRDTNQALVNTVFSFLGEDTHWCGFTRVNTTLEAKVRRDGDIGLIMIESRSISEKHTLGYFQTVFRKQLQKHHWVSNYPQDLQWGIKNANRMVLFAERLGDNNAADAARESLKRIMLAVEPLAEYSLGWWWRRKPKKI